MKLWKGQHHCSELVWSVAIYKLHIHLLAYLVWQKEHVLEIQGAQTFKFSATFE